MVEQDRQREWDRTGRESGTEQIERVGQIGQLESRTGPDQVIQTDREQERLRVGQIQSRSDREEDNQRVGQIESRTYREEDRKRVGQVEIRACKVGQKEYVRQRLEQEEQDSQSKKGRVGQVS